MFLVFSVKNANCKTSEEHLLQKLQSRQAIHPTQKLPTVCVIKFRKIFFGLKEWSFWSETKKMYHFANTSINMSGGKGSAYKAYKTSVFFGFGFCFCFFMT